jgi:CubicO group peptidase (beta-lactamase class C family)
VGNVNALQDYFQALEAADAFSGVVSITRAGVPLFAGAFGYANRAWKVRNSLDVRFDTASITKLFTAVATLQLIDRKRLALDTAVVDFLDLRETRISGDVTVFHLLTHTSGIGDDADEEAGESYEAIWANRPNYSVTETADFLPQFAHKPPNFAAGQGCRYCNCGYVLLGLLIERAGGLRYRDYVRQNVFARAGLADSDFMRMDRVSDNVAEGSDPLRDESGRISAWKKNIYSYPPVGSPDGGAHATAGDLDRFLRAVKAGALLSPETTAAFFTPQAHYRTVAGGTAKYGYGLMFVVDATDRVVFYEKDGINAGASGVIRHYPEDDLTVVILSNMEKGAWGPIARVHEWVVGGHSR